MMKNMIRDKFRINLRKNSCVCIRNNAKIVLVIYKDDYPKIGLWALEKRLYNDYSLKKDINTLINKLDKFKTNREYGLFSEILTDLTELNTELELLKLPIVTFQANTIPVRKIKRDLNNLMKRLV